MKRLLPWLILPWLTLSQADDTLPQKNILNQVSEEAAQTSLENVDVSNEGTSDAEPTITPPSEVDLEKLTQSVALRLSELLGTKKPTDSEQLTLSLETVVSDALHDGKQMDEIRSAVAQAMSDVTGQSGMPDTKLSANTTAVGSREPAAALASSTTTSSNQSSPTGSAAQAQGNNPENLNLQGNQTLQPTIPTTATVLPGESLFTLAQRIYGQENGRRFLDIYAANRDVIKDINVVIEGQVLKLPPPKVEAEQ